MRNKYWFLGVVVVVVAVHQYSNLWAHSIAIWTFSNNLNRNRFHSLAIGIREKKPMNLFKCLNNARFVHCFILNNKMVQFKCTRCSHFIIFPHKFHIHFNQIVWSFVISVTDNGILMHIPFIVYRSSLIAQRLSYNSLKAPTQECP